MMRRCSVCGLFAHTLILTPIGYVGWTHRWCARRAGMVVPR